MKKGVSGGNRLSRRSGGAAPNNQLALVAQNNVAAAQQVAQVAQQNAAAATALANGKYKNVLNVLARGNVLAKNGTVKSRSSKFPRQSNLLRGLSGKNAAWKENAVVRQNIVKNANVRYKGVTPKSAKHVAKILFENPSWWQ